MTRSSEKRSFERQDRAQAGRVRAAPPQAALPDANNGAQKSHLSDLLDEAGRESFPASDPPAVTPARPRAGNAASADMKGTTMRTQTTPKAVHTLPSASPAASQPLFHQSGHEIQPFGTIRQFPLALPHDTRLYACQRLNLLLADTQILHALYKKHHWLTRGATFYQLHLLLDKQANEQLELVDTVAERIQTLGGVAVGDPRHVAELTRIPRAPNGCEAVPAMLSRLLAAHETILADAHEAAAKLAALGDDGSNDLIVSDVIRTNEKQAWFLAEHLVDTPLVRA